MVSSRQKEMIIIANCESKFVMLTLSGPVLIGWQTNVVTQDIRGPSVNEKST